MNKIINPFLTARFAWGTREPHQMRTKFFDDALVRHHYLMTHMCVITFMGWRPRASSNSFFLHLMRFARTSREPCGNEGVKEEFVRAWGISVLPSPTLFWPVIAVWARRGWQLRSGDVDNHLHLFVYCGMIMDLFSSTSVSVDFLQTFPLHLFISMTHVYASWYTKLWFGDAHVRHHLIE